MPESIHDYAERTGISLVIATGFDDCIIGTTETWPVQVVYSRQRIIEKLERQGMDYEESVEYYDFNILGSYIENGPVYVEELTDG